MSKLAEDPNCINGIHPIITFAFTLIFIFIVICITEMLSGGKNRYFVVCYSLVAVYSSVGIGAPLKSTGA